MFAIIMQNTKDTFYKIKTLYKVRRKANIIGLAMKIEE